MKADLLFVGLNMNVIIQKKMRQKKAHFVDDALNSRSIIYLNADTVVVCHPYQNFWLRACFIWQKHFCRFLPLAEQLAQMVIWEVRNGWPAQLAMTAVIAQFNGQMLSSFQCWQALSALFLSAMCEL